MLARTGRLLLVLVATVALAACGQNTGGGEIRQSLAPVPTRSATASDFLRAEANAALEAFVGLLAADDRAFRIDERATLSTPAGGYRATYRLDVVGEDMRGDLRISGADRTVRWRFILVDDGFWARLDSAGWKKVARGTLSASDELEVLAAGVQTRHLAFKEQTTVDGRALYHFRTRAPIAYESDTMESPGSINRMAVFIDEAGMPVSVEVEYSGIYQLIPSIKGRITVTAELAFSRIGKPVTIEPPA